LLIIRPPMSVIIVITKISFGISISDYYNTLTKEKQFL
jgi:hypothetical protein